MIVRIIVTAVFCFGTFGRVLGESYSNVYFQLGTNGIPVDYVNYGAPVAYPSAQAQQAPLTSVIQLQPVSSLVAPCVAPCIIPNQPVGNAKLIAYTSPNEPLDDGPSNYEYSYVVFDEETGDKKAQHEVSDEGIVRGQYSLVQPDGYIREVQYTADNLKGFKAVVTNFLPKDVPTFQNLKTKEPALPQENSSHDALKEKCSETHGPENEPTSEGRGMESSHEQEHGHEGEPSNGKHEVKPDQDLHNEESSDHGDSHGHGDGHTNGDGDENSNIHGSEHNEHESSSPHSTGDSQDHDHGHNEPHGNGHGEENHSAEIKEIMPRSSDHSHERSEHSEHSEVQENILRPNGPTHEALTESNNFNTYSNIIKCIQASIKNSESPLAYILLPSKPCP